jgi:rubrerythrin
MSLRSKLRKLVDPVENRRPEYEHMSDTVFASPPRPEVHAADAGGGLLRCKVCGFRSDDASYCPSCLAETMRPVPRPRARR